MKSLLFEINTPDRGIPDLKAVRSYLRKNDYSFDTCCYVNIILEEILSAILQHSSSLENTYYLGIKFSNEHIEIKVTDATGKTFDVPKICGFAVTDISVLEEKGELWSEILKNVIKKTFHEKISKTNVSIITLKTEKIKDLSHGNDNQTPPVDSETKELPEIPKKSFVKTLGNKVKCGWWLD